MFYLYRFQNDAHPISQSELDIWQEPMKKRIWKPSLVGCPSQVSFQVEPFEPFLPRARHSAFPLPPVINWLAIAVGWQPQSIAGAFKSQFNFWKIFVIKSVFQNVWLISVTKILKLSSFDVGDRCGMLALESLQHNQNYCRQTIQLSYQNSTYMYVTNISVANTRHRHRRIQINPSDLISVSSRQIH